MIKPKSDLCKAFIYHDVEKEELEVRATAKEIVVYFREREPNFPFIRDPFVIQILISNTAHTRKQRKMLKEKQRTSSRRSSVRELAAGERMYPVNHVFT